MLQMNMTNLYLLLDERSHRISLSPYINELNSPESVASDPPILET